MADPAQTVEQVRELAASLRGIDNGLARMDVLGVLLELVTAPESRHAALLAKAGRAAAGMPQPVDLPRGAVVRVDFKRREAM